MRNLRHGGAPDPILHNQRVAYSGSLFLPMLRLPGLIDPHVHMREPGAVHKEDWDTGTAAALAGGFTAVLAMPNTRPPIFDEQTLGLSLEAARQKARCDYAQFVGAGPDNASAVSRIAGRAAGLKMYLDMTFGQLRLDDMSLWQSHFQNWPVDLPLVVHAESRSMAAAMLMAAIYDRAVHIAHISLREEILLIKAARERGIKVTCEVTPHHLFLTEEDSKVGESLRKARTERGPAAAGTALRCRRPVGQPGRHRLLRHGPRPAYAGRKELRVPAAGVSRSGDRSAAPAHGCPRWAADGRSDYREVRDQPAPDLQPSRPA